MLHIGLLTSAQIERKMKTRSEFGPQGLRQAKTAVRLPHATWK